MSNAKVTVFGPAGVQEVGINSGGVLIGRQASCDIVLDSQQVSRRHARLYMDPFGRWIIEDLGSHNGVWIGGQRVQTATVCPGERITIGQFALAVARGASDRISADMTIAATSTVVESSMQESFTEALSDTPESLTSRWLKELNAIGERVSKVMGASDLYPEVCRNFQTWPSATAAVIRLSRQGQGSPEILACSLGMGAEKDSQPATGNLRLSSRVLERVRSSGAAVLAGNVRLCQEQIELTIQGRESSQIVCCAPISVAGDMIEALYLELPSERMEAGVLDFVRALARQVGFAKNSILAADETSRRRLLDHHLELAREIQDKLTPKLLNLPASVDLALHYKPAMWVGGDYCDLWQQPDGRIAFAIGDVAGKGLPAALAMANLHAALRTILAFCDDLPKAASYLNQHVVEHFPEGLFVTLLLGVFSPDTGQLDYINAGHLLPILVGPQGASEIGRPINQFLGLEGAVFKQESIVLTAGWGFVAVTDGITETQSSDGRMMEPQGVMEAAKNHLSGPSKMVVAAILEAAARMRDSMPQQDDMTILALRRPG